MIPHTTTRWSPQTPTERDMVLRELNAILGSHHFRNSKRYPALLRYVVDKTLDGHSDQLKERTLGMEVFDRPPDYDTIADPIVRFSAGEIRKRIAQFYHENGNDSLFQIDLPLGSYVPQFKPRSVPLEPRSSLLLPESATLADPRPTDKAAHLRNSLRTATHAGIDLLRGNRSRAAFNTSVFVTAILLLAIASAGVYALRRSAAPTLIDRLWKPLLKSPGSVLIVLGNGPHDLRFLPASEETTTAAQTHGPYNHISFCEAVALSRLSDVLVNHTKPYQIKEADLTTLQDIRDRSVVLIGAYNNLWTMRLLEPLRFNFRKQGTLVEITDNRHPEHHGWSIDYAQPYSAARYDYAIVARYADSTTNGGALIIAGIGAYGTEAASESAAAPAALDKLLASAPKGWENKNIEMVIRTAIINGEAGPPDLLAVTTW